jgi:hypothetical protein
MSRRHELGGDQSAIAFRAPSGAGHSATTATTDDDARASRPADLPRAAERLRGTYRAARIWTQPGARVKD